MQDGMPAWIICEDILIKIKEELILEAVDVLKKEISNKSIEIDGKFITTPDKPSETGQDMFIIYNLLSREEEIRSRYQGYINELEKGKNNLDYSLLTRIEDLKKFLLSLTQLAILMNFAKVLELWINDVTKEMRIKEPSGILVKTINQDPQRIDALRFILNSTTFAKSNILAGDEYNILKTASSP